MSMDSTKLPFFFELQTATMADFITLDLVKGHLKDMGYDPASISKEALHEFVLELQDIYTERLLRESKTDADSIKSTSIPDNSERHSLHAHSNIKSESLKLDSTTGDDDSEYFDAYSRDLLSHRHGNSSDSEVDLEKWENEVDEMTEEQLLDKLRQINLKRTANLSTSTYSNRLDSSTISEHSIRITNSYRGFKFNNSRPIESFNV